MKDLTKELRTLTDIAHSSSIFASYFNDIQDEYSFGIEPNIQHNIPFITSTEHAHFSQIMYDLYDGEKTLYTNINDFMIDAKKIYLKNVYLFRRKLDLLNTDFEHRIKQVETITDTTIIDEDGTMNIDEDASKTMTTSRDETSTLNNDIQLDSFGNPQFSNIENAITNRENTDQSQTNVIEADGLDTDILDRTQGEISTKDTTITKTFTKENTSTRELEDLKSYFDMLFKQVYVEMAEKFSSLFLTFYNYSLE